MKVLIINPPAYQGIDFVREGRCEQRMSSFQYCMAPISLPSIAGLLLKNKMDVKIIDCIAEKMDADALLKLVNDYRPDLTILNMATASYDGDRIIAKQIKEKTNTHLTAIGNQVTSLPDMVLNETELDSVVIGEPEFTILDLAERLGGDRNLSEVEGIHFKQNGRVTANPRRAYIENLDDLPFPARHLLDNQKYFLPVINQPYTLLISSRGCKFNCIFCTAHQYYGKKLRLRSPERVLQEIDEIINKHKIKNITMWSDTFTLNREFVMEVCKGIIKHKFDVQWMTNSRVDTVDPEMLNMMRKANCIGISYGIESGVQEILNNVKKGTTVEQISKAIGWTKAAGIESLAHVIFGLPGETPQTIEQTIKFIKKIDPDYAQFYCAIPFPGTKFYEMANKNNWIISRDWSKYELNQVVISTPQLSAEELKEAKVKAYKKFYLRPKYITKRIGKIRSADEIMVNLKQGFNFISSWVLKS